MGLLRSLKCGFRAAQAKRNSKVWANGKLQGQKLPNFPDSFRHRSEAMHASVASTIVDVGYILSLLKQNALGLKLDE